LPFALLPFALLPFALLPFAILPFALVPLALRGRTIAEEDLRHPRSPLAQRTERGKLT
jgi:hypothetical protein